MSRDLKATVDLPATVGDVFALRTSQRWVDLKAERLHDGSALVQRTESPTGAVTLSVSRNLPQGAPGFLERFLPQDGKVIQNETWKPPDSAGICTGTWTVEIPGAPAKLGGTTRLEPVGDGSRQTITGTAKVSIPLIGGKAEQYVVDMTTKLINREGQLMLEALRP
ncbi:MAG: DUF2505 domain-containing protein [Mycobacteriales bacterium]